MLTRSEVVIRRTYARPLDKDETLFETWSDICERVVKHQRWLWARAKGASIQHIGRTEGDGTTRVQERTTNYTPLTVEEAKELDEFKQLMLDKKLSVSGRTLWLGNTEVAKRREASQFNCSFTNVETVYDVVDVLWLLMQGCGVGFKPIVGTLNGFFKPIKDIEVIRTKRTTKGGVESNRETFEEGVWTITVGDSAEAWAKSIGKLLAGKYNASKLVLDFSELRPAGSRLAGYGWISSGDSSIATAYTAIANIMSKRAGQLLTRIDILDIVNWLGTILSSRRSAQIALFEYGQPEWKDFAIAKREFWNDNIQRGQSNNSLVFESKPERHELVHIFKLMEEAGGSEPGFVNGQTAKKRAPWFAGSNPCCEILLGNKSFCNLVEIDVAKFRGDTTGLHRALELAARANYRQTCVNLKDGILQEAWHLNNEFLRLCGVGLTGISQRDDLSEYDLDSMKRVAVASAYSMADELGLQRPKNVTTISYLVA